MKQVMRNLVTFRVGSQWYGIDIENVIEISHLVMLSEAVTSSPDILGLMTLRNVVMPVLDLRMRFGNSQPEFRLDTPIIAIRAHERSMGLIVDEIDNVETIAPEQIAPDLGEALPFVAGTTQLHDRLLLLLKLDALGGV